MFLLRLAEHLFALIGLGVCAFGAWMVGYAAWHERHWTQDEREAYMRSHPPTGCDGLHPE